MKSTGGAEPPVKSVLVVEMELSLRATRLLPASDPEAIWA